jgi:uncharacterized repeat protein (TIGR03847 family)
MDIDLDPVIRITTDAVGPPGERTFFLQGRAGDQLVTVLVEKQQVQLLAASIVEILARIGKPTGDGPPEEEMDLEEPVMPEWRVGRLAISYIEDRDVILLEVEELIPGQDEDEDDEEDGDEDEENEGAEGDENDDDDRGSESGDDAPGDEQGSDEGEGEGEGEEPSGGAGGDADDLLDPTLEEGREAGTVRFWATREQMLALARHGAEVASRGRPRCRFCDLPMDPEGHVCPAMNGHRTADDE